MIFLRSAKNDYRATKHALEEERMDLAAQLAAQTLTDEQVQTIAEMAAALAQPGALRTMIHWYRAAFRYSACAAGSGDWDAHL